MPLVMGPKTLDIESYLSGFEAGERSRPTDDEIRAWADELVERAYTRGYQDGLAVHEHREMAEKIVKAMDVTAARQRPGSGYIKRVAA